MEALERCPCCLQKVNKKNKLLELMILFWQCDGEVHKDTAYQRLDQPVASSLQILRQARGEGLIFLDLKDKEVFYLTQKGLDLLVWTGFDCTEIYKRIESAKEAVTA